MREHRSPWLEGLKSGRVVNPLEGQKHADVVIVGGGIAGVSTAFELLGHGEMTVMLIEADRIAHGASGNGSGQVTPSFEGGFSSLAERFGPDLAKAAFRQIVSSKRRFGDVARVSGFRDQVHQVRAYIGFSSIDTAEALGRSSLRSVSDKQPLTNIYAATGSGWNCDLKGRGIQPIPTPPGKILKMLGTQDDNYRAAAVTRTSIANVALICEGLVQRMLNTYPERFTIHEGTRALSVHSDRPLSIRCEKGEVECKRAVICTNGYRLPDLSDTSNSFPDDFLHCVTGYMNGYRPLQKGEKVGLFFHEVEPSADEPYIFSTTWGADHRDEILMVGGPQYTCDGGVRRASEDERAHSRIDHLASEIFGIKEKAVAYWDGPMGYTGSGVRLAGPDPKNPDLFYNLGCNGIGILHSVYGAHRIADLMAGKKAEDSVFDPIHQFDGYD